MKSDIEIAQQAGIRPITEIAGKLGIHEDELELYGRYKAKLPLKLIDREKAEKNNLILVTAISPTPAGRRQNYSVDRSYRRVEQDRKTSRSGVARTVVMPCIRA